VGRLYDRPVPHWKKPCPDCGKDVERDTALPHLEQAHGCMFRVEPWMHVLGMPEESFDELLAFIRKLKSGAARKEADGEQ
jgi:hypothetical protein